MSERTERTEPRPRFSERDGRLLLSAVWHRMKAEPRDREWKPLYERLEKLYGDGPLERDNAHRMPDERKQAPAEDER